MTADARKLMLPASLVVAAFVAGLGLAWKAGDVRANDVSAINARFESVSSQMATKDDVRDLKKSIDALREEIKVARLELRDR